MGSGPTLSVATPSFNSLAKLRRCVGSIRGQRDVAVEHLIQDAGSTDGTAPWLAQAGVSAVVDADEGMYDAINRAWSRSRGEIVSWLNADEQYLPGTLATVSAYFDAHPHVDILFGNYIVVDAGGRPVALRREIPFRRRYVANGFLNVQSCALFFRRRLLVEGLLHFDTRLRYAADQDLMLRLAAAGAVIHHLAEYLSLFGIDGTNLTTHARATEEAETVRRRHGALRFSPLRHVVLAGRRAERLWQGCYRHHAISYLFALDEAPRYVEYSAARVGGRYRITAADSDVRVTRRVVT